MSEAAANQQSNSEESASKDDFETYRGTVARVTYRSPENGYTVLQLDLEDKQETLTVVGHCLPFSAGTDVVVRGTITTHPKFGEQIQAKTADEVQPTTVDGIRKYLGSGLISGVGPKTAERIVDAFGTDALSIIYNEPDRLKKIAGISASKAETIHTALIERQERMENERFFAEHDISVGLARRIIDRYGEKAISKVKRDPYVLIFEMRGIGFATADSLALKLGFDPASGTRIRGALFNSLQTAQNDGHCYQTKRNLIRFALKLLKPDDRNAERFLQNNSFDLDELLSEFGDFKFEERISSLEHDGFIKRIVSSSWDSSEERYYIRRLYEAEQFVGRFIAERAVPREKPLLDAATIQQSLVQAESELGLQFSFEQRNAVELATEYPFLVVTGGPGCGKTTIIRALAATFVNADKVLALAAPTGKAAQRMSQVTGMNASTIHRLLKYDPRSNSFCYNAATPLCIEENGEELQIDALIVDEASMLDIQLTRDLFSAIPLDATVILVGDKDQLPSVGPGKVFAELVGIPEIKVIALSKLFRRSEESRITTIAHSINSGHLGDLPQPDGVTKSDLYFIEKNEPEACARVIESLVCDQIPRKFDIPIKDITVLTPSNRGPIGTVELNRRLQESLNPAAEQASIVRTQRGEFRLGDRVCQRVNNYKIDLFGVFNGDIGEVYQLDESNNSIVVELWDGRLIRYSEKDLQQLSLSYAMTVHRSQGSEMPCVVLALHTSHFTLLERQLFYTAVTRAKKLLIIVGSQRALSLAAKRTSSRERLTSLKDSVQSCFTK